MLSHYITLAARSFWRFKLTAAVNTLGLALGLVCFLATYLFIEDLVRSDTHFKNASRIYALTQEIWTSPVERMVPAFSRVAPPVAKFLPVDFPALEAVARALSLGPIAAATDDRKVDLFAAAVDPAFVRIFDLPFLSGDPDAALASPHNAIITERAATRLFGTSNVVGRHILLQNRTDVTVAAVIGALPQPSHMGDSARASLPFDVLVPMDLLKGFQSTAGIGVPVDPDGPQWGNDTYFTYALLPADGSLTPEEFKAGLKTFGDRHVPKDQLRSVFGAIPVSRINLSNLEALFGGHAVSPTTSVFLLDALILAIACLNYANLAVAIATTRAKEIGMRKILGANRFHLMRQYLVEAMLLGGVALVIVLVGLALAIPPLNRALGTDLHFASLLQPQLIGLVVVLLGAISLVGGAYPALVLSRVRPVDALRAGAVRAGPRFVPTVLVGVQFAAASFLLVVALLMLNQNRELQRSGIRPDRDPVIAIANDTKQLGVGFDTLRTELLRDPHIKFVSASNSPPWQSGGWHYMLRRSQDASAATQVTILNQISYDFFPTLGINVLAGRAPDREHGDEVDLMELFGPKKGPPPIVIDRALALQVGWSDPNEAVGQLIYDSPPENTHAKGIPLRVVGVVENGYPRLIGPNTDSNMYLLVPAMATVPLVSISRSDIPAALAHIDRVWEKLAPKAPLRREFMDEMFDRAYESFAAISGVLVGLAAFAFFISIMGLCGMAIYVTSRRQREIGIRKTLGASKGRVVLMLLRDFAKPVVIANVMAWPFAYLMGRIYLNLFVQRTSLSPWPFVLSFVITLAIAWIAVTAQALRAAAVKPANVLYAE